MMVWDGLGYFWSRWIGKNSVLKYFWSRWIDKNTALEYFWSRWIDENSGLDVLVGGAPSVPMRSRRAGTPQKAIF